MRLRSMHVTADAYILVVDECESETFALQDSAVEAVKGVSSEQCHGVLFFDGRVRLDGDDPDDL